MTKGAPEIGSKFGNNFFEMLKKWSVLTTVFFPNIKNWINHGINAIYKVSFAWKFDQLWKVDDLKAPGRVKSMNLWF